MNIRVIAALLAIIGASCTTTAARVRTVQWVGTWGAAPLPPRPALGPMAATPSFSNQTIRQIVRISAGGERVRVRFTNEYGTKPLRIGAARVAIADASGTVHAGSEQPILFAGQPSGVVPTGAPLFSDPVALPVHALETLSISVYLPEDTGPCTCHEVGAQTAYVSSSGDFTADSSFKPERTIEGRAFIAGIEVESKEPGQAIVVLGDSISDGVGSTPGTNHRWPDLLAERLVGHQPSAAWGIVNMGISGNRILNDGAGSSALTRFDRDVLAVSGLRYLIIFEGVNDLGVAYGHPTGPFAFVKTLPSNPSPTAEAMIAGYRQLIERAHAHGVQVFGATIAPYSGAFYYSEEGDAVRRAINRWIRTGGAFDAVLDFDAVLRDPAQPSQIAPALHAGDHLHGSDAGYAALAASIDLGLFKPH